MWDWGHRLVTHAGNTSFQISKGRQGGGHHDGPTTEFDTQAICPSVPRDPESLPSLAAVLIIPAQVQSRQLNHSNPHPLGCHKHGTPNDRRVQLGPQATENSNSPPCLQVGDTGRAFTFMLQKAQEPALSSQNMCTPPTGSVTCWLAFCLQRRHSHGPQTGARKDQPAFPHRPGPTAARKSFIPKQSCSFCNVWTMYRKSRRQTMRTTDMASASGSLRKSL